MTTQRCYKCSSPAVGSRDRTPDGGQVEPACFEHADKSPRRYKWHELAVRRFNDYRNSDEGKGRNPRKITAVEFLEWSLRELHASGQVSCWLEAWEPVSLEDEARDVAPCKHCGVAFSKHRGGHPKEDASVRRKCPPLVSHGVAEPMPEYRGGQAEYEAELVLYWSASTVFEDV